MSSATLHKKRSSGLKSLCLALALLVLVCRLQAQTSREYSIKAVFLYNFTRFVEWPASAIGGNDAPFVIGILGDDPFHTAIDDAVRGEMAKGHTIVVQRYRHVRDIRNCQILFISNSESRNVRDILSALPDKSMLTVSDIADFATSGGIIRFITRENKIKLQINLAASRGADLDISSKLLQVAEIVQ